VDIRTVLVELIGEMPLLMHADNIEWSDLMDSWKNEPSNKTKSKAGDDRTPPWRWIGSLNYDNPQSGVVTIPSEYVMRCVMGGAAEVPTGRGRKTFKELSQTGILCSAFHWPLLVKGKPISMDAIEKLRELRTFKEHTEAVQKLGFSLYVKRAKIGESKHIRVRPRFDNWSTSGELTIVDDLITNKVLIDIFDIAGRLKGLGDWRPSAPKRPGPFGTFKAKITSV
jgi:hypothetical protein